MDAWIIQLDQVNPDHSAVHVRLAHYFRLKEIWKATQQSDDAVRFTSADFSSTVTSLLPCFFLLDLFQTHQSFLMDAMPVVSNIAPSVSPSNCLGRCGNGDLTAGQQASSSKTFKNLSCTVQGPVSKMQSVLSEVIHYFGQHRSREWCDDCGIRPLARQADWPNICGLQPSKGPAKKERREQDDDDDDDDDHTDDYEHPHVTCWRWVLQSGCHLRPRSKNLNRPVKLISVLREERKHQTPSSSRYRRINLTDSVSCVPVTKVERFKSATVMKSPTLVSHQVEKKANIKQAVYRLREACVGDRKHRSREQKADKYKRERPTVMFQDLDMLDGLHGGEVQDLQDCPTARLAKESRVRLRNLNSTHRGRTGQTRMTELLIRKLLWLMMRSCNLSVLNQDMLILYH